MEDRLILLSRAIAILLALYIIYRVKKNQLNEKESFFWISGSVLMLVLTFFPGLLHSVSQLVGIQYPPATLFLFSVIVMFVILYRQFIRISAMSEKIKDLVQTIAILSQEVEELKRRNDRAK